MYQEGDENKYKFKDVNGRRGDINKAQTAKNMGRLEERMAKMERSLS